MKEKHEFQFLYEYYNLSEGFNNENFDLFINNVKSHSIKCYFFKSGIYFIKLKFKNNVVDCERIFSECENIIAADLSDLNCENLVKTKNMFKECKNLLHVNLPISGMKKVEDMSSMFYNCKNLINVSNFDSEMVTNMSEMFYHCNFFNIDLTSLNLKNLNNMKSMFEYCEKLKNVDLHSMNFPNLNDMSNSFSSCKNF